MIKHIKNIVVITISIVILSTLTLQVQAVVDPCEEKRIGSVQVLGKSLPVFVRGNGTPMLVVGPATLFRDAKLVPNSFYNHFRVYFVDMFIKTSSDKALDFNKLTLNDFIKTIEVIRNALKINKMILFGHSSNGVLALRYSEQFHEHVLCNVLVGTPPFRGMEKTKLSEDFFEKNAADDKKKIYAEDQGKIANNQPTFIEKYNAKRALNFFDPMADGRENIWDGINLDEKLMDKYFSLIDDFDIRKSKNIVKVPTFLALGRHDYACPYTLWTEKSEEVLNDHFLKHVIFDESAHYPMIENESTFMRELLLFLAENEIQICKTNCLIYGN